MKKTGEQVLVLVYEYDKSFLQNTRNNKMKDNIKNILKGFYGNIKSEVLS